MAQLQWSDIDRGSRPLQARYTPVERLGSGGPASVWRAVDRETDAMVVIKTLPVADAPDWKSLELFEREVQTLATLDHPQIPEFLDAFPHRGAAGEPVEYCLVQDYVDGRDLATAIEAGETWTDAEIVALLSQLLDVLAYLHSHSPPIVHRDVKPANLIRRGGAPLTLVDLGAVQIESAETLGGSTIVGTSGYLPVEQLMGRAEPASDVYAVGATAVHLLARTHPSELSVERNRLQYRSRTDIAEPLAAVLERALEPAAEDRYRDADAMRRALREGRNALPTRRGGVGPRDAARREWEVDRAMEVGERMVTLERPPEWLELEQMTRDESVYTFAEVHGPETTVPFRRTSLRLSRRLVEVQTTSPLGRNSLFALGAAVLAIAVIEAWFLLFVPVLLAVTPPETTVRLGRDGITRKAGLTVSREVDDVALEKVAEFEADEGAVRALRRDGSEVPVTDGLAVEQAEWLAGLLNDWLFAGTQ